jgi:GNAT superfamily N-acetyltransferase
MDAPEGGTSPPELLQIFVDPARRSQSLGGLLLERIEALLRARGVLEYCARTPARDNDATLRFYSRRQFTPLAERQFCGVTYVELRRLVGARGPVP